MKIRNLPAFIAVMALLAACSDPRPPEEIVAERAQARWDALVAGDFERAWSYYSPGYRAQNPVSGFASSMQGRPIRWDEAVVKLVECSDQACTVTVEVVYTAVGAPGPMAGMQNTRAVSETWLELEGAWWYSSAD